MLGSPDFLTSAHEGDRLSALRTGHTEDPHILGTTGQNLVSLLTWCTGSGQPLRAMDMYRQVATQDSVSLTQELRLYIL
jgi:hypothetical protein